VAVNPVTNKIYVANITGNSVTVIDGATNTTATVATGIYPIRLAVNPVTNKIYVANYNDSSVTVIDGATNTTATVAAGSNPIRVAVNPVTNKIYIANYSSSSVTVIDGATNAATTVATGSNPIEVAVNPVTNKIYVTNGGSAVSVIDGASDTIMATVTVGTSAGPLAVNTVTNKIYVTTFSMGNVIVIDGVTDTVTTTIAVYGGPQGLVVNPVTNKIYVANASRGNAIVIDGATNTSAYAVGAGAGGEEVAVNPVTNRIYIANKGWNNVTVLVEQKEQPIPLLTKITPLTDNQTTSRTPSFSLQTLSTYAPFTPSPLAVYFQVDTWQGPWTRANGSNPAFSGQTKTLSLGTHLLFAFATDGQDAGINGNALNGQVTIGKIAAYPFAVMQASTATALTADVNPSVAGGMVTLTATLTAIAPGTGTPTGTVTFLDGTTTLGTGSLNSSGVATLATSALTAGTHSLTAQYGGDTNFSASTSAALSQAVLGTTTTGLSPLTAASYGTPVTCTATVKPGGGGTLTGTVMFLDGTTVLGTRTLNGSGVATFTTSTLTVGTHSITAKYNGSANFAGSTSAAGTETITPATTTAALVSSAASASSGAPVTFTATITSSTSGMPTGTVNFLDGTTVLGTGTLNGSGVATLTTSTLAVGTHSITAAFGGDSNFAASTSTVLSQVVLAPSFALSGSPSSSTVSAGNPASYQIMVTGKNNFSSAVALSCSAGLPTGASCAFSPVSVTPGASPATSTLMISTTPHTTALLLPFSGGRKAPVFAGWLLVPAMVFGLLGLAVPRRRLRLGYALGLLLAGCVFWQSGCAGNVSSTTGGTTGGTPAGTFPVTVSGSAGTAQQTASVTLVVQ
jgi:YVTN family beta-propeller protein